MREMLLKKLIKSDPKIIQYCIKRILTDEDTKKVLEMINKEIEDEIQAEKN